MTQPEDRLRKLFIAHEDPIPDPIEVYAGALQRGRVHRGKRRAVQIAGGAALTASVVVGGVSAGGLLPHRAGPSISAASAGVTQMPSVAAAATASASPSASPSTAAGSFTAEDDKDMQAFFSAGYTYDDAVALAKLWHATGDASVTKVAAGKKLVAGETLPIKPGTSTAAPAATEDPDIAAFFAAGYTYADAVTLQKLWTSPKTPYDAKVLGGSKLLAGETLPIAP